MTRFARYSTKGIKKPPQEATPWSELAPPAAAKHTVAAFDEMPMPKGSEKKAKGKMPSSKVLSHTTDSTGRKVKKNAAKRLSLPPAALADFDGSESGTEDPNEVISRKMNGKQFKASDKDIGSSGGQSTKKKKKRVSEDAILSNDVEGNEDHVPALDHSERSDDVKSPKKGMKRKNKDGALLNNKKGKRPNTDNEVANLPASSEDQQVCDTPEQPLELSQTTPRNVNGHSGPPNKKNNRNQQKQKNQQKPLATGTAPGAPLLAEGPLMTQFEGYWVRRRAVPRLEKVRDQLAATISDPQSLKREMKKRKRAEHRLLLSQLSARGARKPTSAAARLQGDTNAAEDDLEEDPAVKDADGAADAAEDGEGGGSGEEEAAGAEPPPRRRTVADDRNPSTGPPKEDRMVKFDGVWMTADAVGRLKELRRQLKLQRVSDMVLKQTMKTARRREEMKRKRDAKRVCLGCRQPGHFVSDCPHRVAGTKAPVTGLCFRCGSTEHRLSECRRPADGTKLPYAVCFVCGQTGHLSRECSLNPNGVYPKGGACKVCHRRDHLADDCPEKREEQAASTGPRLATINDGALEDDYQHDFREAAAPTADSASEPAVRKPRLVKF